MARSALNPAKTSAFLTVALVWLGVALGAAEAKDADLNPASPATTKVWPDATNTGVPLGTTLDSIDDDITVREAGTVIDAKRISGCVVVYAPGVIIRRSKMRCVMSSGYTGERLLIEDSEIDCRDSERTGRTTAVGDNNFIARRLNIHNCENGFDVDVDVTIEDSWIHDLFDDGKEAHTDGIQIAIGRNVRIERNRILVKQGTSALISHPTDMVGVVIRENLLGGGAYTLYCPRKHSRDVHVIGNRFSRLYYPRGGAYGPWTDCRNVETLRDNVWDDTGRPLGRPN